MSASAMPTRKREQERSQGQHTCKHKHQGRQSIDHQDDAKRRPPVAEEIDTEALAAVRGTVGGDEEDDCNSEERGDREDVDRRP